MAVSEVHELVLLDQASRALSEAKCLDEIKMIRDKAEAVRKYAQSASLGLEIQNRAAEVKLRAERRAGTLISQLDLRGGDRRSKHHRDRLKLENLGISKNQSTRWQREAEVPEAVFCEYVRRTCGDNKELTAAGLMRLVKPRTRRAAARNTNRSQGNGSVASDSEPLASLDCTPEVGSFADIVNELSNHRQLLDSILRPLYSGESDQVGTAERRAVRYLLREMKLLMEALEQMDGPEQQLRVVNWDSA